MATIFGVFDLVSARPTWHRRAACRGADPNLFFLERGEDPQPAKNLCAVCPVQPECLAAAVEGHELGIWAGTAERTRTQMKRPRAA